MFSRWVLVMMIFGMTDRLGSADEGFCPLTPPKDPSSGCGGNSEPPPKNRYLFYDINAPEGFNLRRDVYMRLAVFMHKLNKKDSKNQWTLILPPWNNLYHWQKDFDQSDLPWAVFFDVKSMKRFVPVKELYEIDVTIRGIDEVYYLQHYKEAFNRKDWDWSDRFSIASCNGTLSKYKEKDGRFYSRIWGYDVEVRDVKCTSFQGGASLLGEIFDLSLQETILVDRAEVVLHDGFGDKLYWECRRSMRFAERLVEQATQFRSNHLNSSDEADNTVVPYRWEDQKGIEREERGGPYVCAHLRRRDFLKGKRNEVPAIEEVADKLKQVLKSLNLTTVFLCTDGTKEEKNDLRKMLNGYKQVMYEPSFDDVLHFKDGGIAIIDQIICSHARHFIGTFESTFSYRIQEEREILGFPEERTFNRFCGLNQECDQPAHWRIVF